MNVNKYVVYGAVTTIVITLMLVGVYTMNPSQTQDDEVDVVTEFSTPEMVAISLIAELDRVAAGQPVDAVVAERIYARMSVDATAGVGAEQAVQDVARSLGLQTDSIADVSIVETVVHSDSQVTVVLRLAVGDMVYERGVHLVLESDQWKVQAIEDLDVRPPVNGTIPPPTAPPEPVEPDPGTEPEVLGACYIDGCSGQICSDRPPGDVVTTCEWLPEYACYRQTTCERQVDGTCGWTETPEFLACLANPDDPDNI